MYRCCTADQHLDEPSFLREAMVDADPASPLSCTANLSRR